MRAKLIGLRGEYEGQEKAVSPQETCLFGRCETASISLTDSRVSRQHCRISVDGGFYMLEDMGSRNGTWINGKRITRAILFHGDRLILGEQEWRFELEADINEESSGTILQDSGPNGFATEIRERMKPDSASSLLRLSEMDSSEISRADLERDLAAICRIIDEVNAEEQLDRLFDIIMDHVMEVTSAERGYLFVGRRPGGIIVPQVTRYKEGTAREFRSGFSRSVVGECYESGFSILRADPLERESSASESIFRQHIQSVMCVPMNCEEGTVGVIYVDRLAGDRKFTKRDLQVLSAIGNQAGIALRRAQLARQVETLFSDTVRTLVSIIEIKDEYTFGHSERVTDVALRLAELVNLDKSQIRDLRLAGLMHDVGKVGISTDILRKPAKLTESEYRSIKQHAPYGAQIVGSIENAERIAAAIRHHHERWDGSGYPDGLAGDKIPLLARILAMADAFDSMATSRPYREMLTKDEILSELTKGNGTQFDPNLASALVEAFSKDALFQSKIAKVYSRAGKVMPESATHPSKSWPSMLQSSTHA